MAEAGAEIAGELLPGKVWQLTQQSGLSSPPGVIENPSAYTLIFDEGGDQTVTIQADCNTVNAEYTLGPGSITFVLGPTTLAVCSADSLSQAFLDALTQASGLEIDPGGNSLVITSGEFSTIAMLFEPVGGDGED